MIKKVIYVWALMLVISQECFAGYNRRRGFVKKDSPHVTLYANDYHRGKYHHEFFKNSCVNLPSEVDNWASSIDTHNRCVDVCDLRDCEGTCARIYPSSGVNVDLSLKLETVGMNDKITSFKSCYTMMPKKG